MLHEVELLVAGLDGEVVAVGGLVGALGAEGRIGKHHVVALTAVGLVDRVAQIDVRLDAVQEEVHQGQAPGPGHEILAVVGLGLDALGLGAVQDALGLPHQPFVGADEEAAGAAGRIGDLELGPPARVGLHHAADGLNQRTRGEILPRPLLALAGGLFEQALERRALHVHVHGRPILFVDHRDDALEVDGVVEARHGLGEDVGQQPAGFAELAQDVGVVVG